MTNELPRAIRDPLEAMIRAALPPEARMIVERMEGTGTWDLWAEVPGDGSKILNVSDEVVEHLELAGYLAELSEAVMDEFKKPGRRLVKIRRHPALPHTHQIRSGD
jgi:hypothetical protein